MSKSVAVRTAPTSVPAAVFSASSRTAVDMGNVGSLLAPSTPTPKTAESPYMGRLVAGSVKLPAMGPWPVSEESGRPTVTTLAPSVPSPYD